MLPCRTVWWEDTARALTLLIALDTAVYRGRILPTCGKGGTQAWLQARARRVCAERVAALPKLSWTDPNLPRQHGIVRRGPIPTLSTGLARRGTRWTTGRRQRCSAPTWSQHARKATKTTREHCCWRVRESEGVRSSPFKCIPPFTIPPRTLPLAPSGPCRAACRCHTPAPRPAPPWPPSATRRPHRPGAPRACRPRPPG